MPARVAIIQGNSRRLDGLYAPLQKAGHELLDVAFTSSLLEVADGRRVDVLMIDAESIMVDDGLGSVAHCSAFRDAALMLVATDADKAEICASRLERVDDVIILPIGADQLRFRVQSLLRLTSIVAESEHRRQVLAEFGLAPPAELAAPADLHRMSALVVGPAELDHTEIFKALDGDMTIAFAAGAADAGQKLDQVWPDFIIAAPEMPAGEFKALFRTLRSTLDWCDLPVLIVTEAVSLPGITNSSPWKMPELLHPSTRSAVVRLRLRTLVRLRRLRQQLRGLLGNGSSAPVMDAKTKLYDRSFFHHYLSKAVIHNRLHQAPFAIIVCTLEGLHQINQELGYPTGDRFLVEVATQIGLECRAEDLVARMGGNRIGILMREASAQEASVLCRRLHESLRKTPNDMLEMRRSDIRIEFGLSELLENDHAIDLSRRASKRAPRQLLSRAS